MPFSWKFHPFVKKLAEKSLHILSFETSKCVCATFTTTKLNRILTHLYLVGRQPVGHVIRQRRLRRGRGRVVDRGRVGAQPRRRR